jgi:hypothetical protein
MAGWVTYRGMLLDDDTWAIRYLIVDTSNWCLGHQVLIAPRWIQGINWLDATVSVKLTSASRERRASVRPCRAVSVETWSWLSTNIMGRTGYWAEEVNFENPQFRASERRPEPLIKRRVFES